MECPRPRPLLYGLMFHCFIKESCGSKVDRSFVSFAEFFWVLSSGLSVLLMEHKWEQKHKNEWYVHFKNGLFWKFGVDACWRFILGQHDYGRYKLNMRIYRAQARARPRLVFAMNWWGRAPGPGWRDFPPLACRDQDRSQVTRQSPSGREAPCHSLDFLNFGIDAVLEWEPTINY